MYRTAVFVMLLLLVVLAGCDSAPTSPPTSTPSPTGVASPTEALPSPSLPASSGETPAATQTQVVEQGADGRIIYLENDGVTISSVKPDGSGMQTVATISKEAGFMVSALSADPSGTYLVYGLFDEPYSFVSQLYVHHEGKSTRLPGVEFSGRPAWSPDGKSIAAATYEDPVEPGPIYVYELGSAEPKILDFAGKPDWYPDGKRLIVVRQDNLYTIEIETGQVEQLTDLPQEEEGDAWVVQEAHVLPGGEQIIFFGGKFQEDGEMMFGGSGNGQRWWSIPVEGGDPQPWLEPEGNAIVTFAGSEAAGRVAYVGSAHYNACASAEAMVAVEADVPAGQPLHSIIPALDEQEARFVFVNNITWSPDGSMLAYGATPYRCADQGAQWITDTPVIYLWSLLQGAAEGATRTLIEGSYPSWVR